MNLQGASPTILKQKIFSHFLLKKISLQQITHRKVVWKIQKDYLPNLKIKIILDERLQFSNPPQIIQENPSKNQSRITDLSQILPNKLFNNIKIVLTQKKVNYGDTLMYQLLSAKNITIKYSDHCSLQENSHDQKLINLFKIFKKQPLTSLKLDFSKGINSLIQDSPEFLQFLSNIKSLSQLKLRIKIKSENVPTLGNIPIYSPKQDKYFGSIFENFKNLKHFTFEFINNKDLDQEIAKNSLTSIAQNIKKLKHLNTLKIKLNHLQINEEDKVDAKSAFFDNFTLQNNENLRNFDFSINSIQKTYISRILTNTKNSKLEKLNLNMSVQNIDSEEILQTLEKISLFPNLTHLNLILKPKPEESFDSNCLYTLSETLIKLQKLKSLKLNLFSKATLDEKSSLNFLKALQKQQNLMELDLLLDLNFQNGMMNQIFLNFPILENLQKLRIYLGYEAVVKMNILAKDLGKLMSKYPNLTNLDLSLNQRGEDDLVSFKEAKKLMKGISKINNLEILSVHIQKFGNLQDKEAHIEFQQFLMNNLGHIPQTWIKFGSMKYVLSSDFNQVPTEVQNKKLKEKKKIDNKKCCIF